MRRNVLGDNFETDVKSRSKKGVAILLAASIAMSSVACGSKADSNVTPMESETTSEVVEVSEVVAQSEKGTDIEASSESASTETTEVVETEPSETEVLVTEESETIVEGESQEEIVSQVTDGQSETAEDMSSVDEIKEDEYVANRFIDENASLEEEVGLTATQSTCINMLNYMTVLTQQINESKGNQLFLESARTSLYNDTNLKAVDTKTQAQITQLVGTIDDYRMVDVKRDRLVYIYEQNKAQALRQAIPSPVSLLSVVQSGSLLKAAASVVYMAVDSASSYASAANQAEQQFIKEGWNLDDEETKLLQNSTTQQFNYMCNMVRDYDLPDEYVVRDTDVQLFVEWTKKTNLVSKIDWFESNEGTYQKFGPYWLELVKDYYDYGDYEKCLESIHHYEEISSKITRKDIDYATSLPMVIIAAKETMKRDEYIDLARTYCSLIQKNTKDTDWELRYFAAQIYLDLYRLGKNDDDIKAAYDIAYYNVNTLIDEQREMNESYISPIVEVKAEKGASKRTKEEIKQYNKLVKDERKTALPPVSEALYLNCDLLFALAEQCNISSSDTKRIDALLHENGNDLFLTKALDDRFRQSSSEISADDLNVEFDGEKFTIPVTCISDRSSIAVTVSGGTVIDDWTVSEVERPKNGSYSDYVVTFKSKSGKDYKYKAGDIISITVTPVVESPEKTIDFKYEVKEKKVAFVVKSLSFERK